MDHAKIRSALEHALKQQDYGPEAKRRDIAFHMTDWLDDLANWADYCRDPEALDADATEALLIAFLVHVPNHLAAASKLMLDVPVTDVFEIGATQEDA